MHQRVVVGDVWLLNAKKVSAQRYGSFSRLSLTMGFVYLLRPMLVNGVLPFNATTTWCAEVL